MLMEVVGNASAPVMAALVAQVQRAGEPTTWITCDNSILHPPDFLQAGVDLESLACVHIRTRHFGPPVERLHAAEMLIRSGAFGLVMLELPGASPVPTRALSRLLRLARQHQIRVVFRVTDAIDAINTESLGPLVGSQIRVTHDVKCGVNLIRAEVLKPNPTGKFLSDLRSETTLWLTTPKNAETFTPLLGREAAYVDTHKPHNKGAENTRADQTGKFESLKITDVTTHAVDSNTPTTTGKNNSPKPQTDKNRAGLRKSKLSKNTKNQQKHEKTGQISLFSEAV